MLHQVFYQGASVTVFTKNVAKSIIVCWLEQSYYVVIVWLLYLAIYKLAYIHTRSHFSPDRHFSLGCLVRLLSRDFLQGEEFIWAALDLFDEVNVCKSPF